LTSPRTNGEQPALLASTDVAVVICAYTDERWDETLRAVESVRGQSSPVGELVLVVDHNTGLLERFQAHFKDTVRVLENTHRQGLSGARNTGIEATTKAIIGFLDDDAEAQADWVEQLISAYATEQVAGAGGYIEPKWNAPRPGWWPKEFDWVVGCSYTGLPTKRQRVRNPIGANMSVRRSAFDAAGGFSPAIGRIGKHPIGCEETELFIRIAQLQPGSFAVYEPAARVLHNVGAPRATFDYFKRRCFAEGLSKAVVAQLSKDQESLSSEWTYTLKTLPAGVVRNIASGIRGDREGFARAGAIVAGLGITTAGYIRGRLSKGPERNLTGVPSHPDNS
jgi:GT2 family glycosyltransferase